MSVEPTSVEVPERPTVRRRLATKIDVQQTSTQCRGDRKPVSTTIICDTGTTTVTERSRNHVRFCVSGKDLKSESESVAQYPRRVLVIVPVL